MNPKLMLSGLRLLKLSQSRIAALTDPLSTFLNDVLESELQSEKNSLTDGLNALHQRTIQQNQTQRVHAPLTRQN